jgi:hypothetical protein
LISCSPSFLPRQRCVSGDWPLVAIRGLFVLEGRIATCRRRCCGQGPRYRCRLMARRWARQLFATAKHLLSALPWTLSPSCPSSGEELLPNFARGYGAQVIWSKARKYRTPRKRLFRSGLQTACRFRYLPEDRDAPGDLLQLEAQVSSMMACYRLRCGSSYFAQRRTFCPRGTASMKSNARIAIIGAGLGGTRPPIPASAGRNRSRLTGPWTGSMRAWRPSRSVVIVRSDSIQSAANSAMPSEKSTSGYQPSSARNRAESAVM